MSKFINEEEVMYEPPAIIQKERPRIKINSALLLSFINEDNLFLNGKKK